MSKFGKFQGRLEDRRFVTGAGTYASDFALPGMAHGALARSQVAHGRIRSIDLSAAEEVPGVLAIYVAEDLDGGPTHLPSGPQLPMTNGEPAFQAQRPVLAGERVRFVGEGIAFVVAETEAAARDAAALIDVEIDELPAVMDPPAAKAPGAPAIWPQVPDNIAYVWERGDMAAARAAVAGAPKKVQLAAHVSRIAVHAMEPRASVGEVAADGRLTLHSCSQSPHNIKGMIAKVFDVDPAGVHVITRDVGGSFGMKISAYVEDILCLFAAQKLGRPVRWVADRTEASLADDHGRDIRFDGELGFDADGNLLGLAVTFELDIGAYLQGRSVGPLGNLGGISGVYRIGPTAGIAHGVYSNTHTTGPYRGAGRPEATFVIERLLDLAAAELGMDPFELRRKNLIPPDAMPYHTGFLFEYDCGEFEENMKTAARQADLQGFPARKAASEKAGRLRGIGLSNPIEVAGGPFVKPGADHARITVNPDGSALVEPGAMSVGQGLETAFSQFVADTLGIPLEKITYRQGDTDSLPGGRGSGGSASAPTGASCLSVTMDKVIAKGRDMASEMLEAAPGDVEFKDGQFQVTGTDRRVAIGDVAAMLEEAGEKLDGQTHYEPGKVTFPNGCHICEVEVDPETGQVTVERYTVVEDVGRVFSPELVAGQMHGGVAQGAGQSLLERMVYDRETGQPLTASFMDYAMPRADMLPPIDFTIREVPTKVNPVGAKGVGEAGSVGSLAATLNAVCNALAPLGVRHMEMPATPARVWQAIQDAKGGN